MTGLYPSLFLFNLSGVEPKRCEFLKLPADSNVEPGLRATVKSPQTDGKLLEDSTQEIYTSWQLSLNPTTTSNLLQNILCNCWVDLI